MWRVKGSGKVGAGGGSRMGWGGGAGVGGLGVRGRRGETLLEWLNWAGG